ncbi:MAG: tRNA (N6-isopentenyl adenosine(37)-C2)-methylthiotransferase MiaB [Gracilibacteraceae bacterium]|jgi:tRNA-2-methylthio-N6-dimethylallyladenosine synthase|nr:tRNA (N6-isopentenyl adenosine(37)-C2)-methylthiotransferase MiaB [Gracilibacteraceae bacterium]
MSKKVYVQVYGCQMSERDGESFGAMAESQGYLRTASREEADLVVVTTCCVRESAENRIIGNIGQLRRWKAQRPGRMLVVAGCLVQQAGALERLRRRAPHVDIWMGAFDQAKFPDLLREAEGGAIVCAVSDQAGPPVEAAPLAEAGKLSACVNIMYGCDNFCSYCVVPLVRGRERSRPPRDVLDEVRRLAESGTREIVLLGQNVNSYGRSENQPEDFAWLLRAVAREPGLWRVRFTTSHPKDLTDAVIAAVAEEAVICPHFHMPLQAGSDRVLKAMNRGYTTEYYLERVRAIRRAVPEARISTDLIAGFPGETEEDFSETLRLMREIHFSQAFTFMYSRRSGTAAADLPGQLPREERLERLKRMMALQAEMSLAWRRAMVGSCQEVLVVGPSKRDPAMLSGQAAGGEAVVFAGREADVGTLAPVVIREANSWTLFGVIDYEKREDV